MEELITIDEDRIPADQSGSNHIQFRVSVDKHVRNDMKMRQ